MFRVTLADGRTLDMRPMYIQDRLDISDLSDLGDVEPLEKTRRYGAIVERAVVSRSWEGSFLELTFRDLAHVMAEWRRLSEEDAVPPAPGTPSSEPSPEPSSPEPTVDQPE